MASRARSPKNTSQEMTTPSRADRRCRARPGRSPATASRSGSASPAKRLEQRPERHVLAERHAPHLLVAVDDLAVGVEHERPRCGTARRRSPSTRRRPAGRRARGPARRARRPRCWSATGPSTSTTFSGHTTRSTGVSTSSLAPRGGARRPRARRCRRPGCPGARRPARGARRGCRSASPSGATAGQRARRPRRRPRRRRPPTVRARRPGRERRRRRDDDRGEQQQRPSRRDGRRQRPGDLAHGQRRQRHAAEGPGPAHQLGQHQAPGRASQRQRPGGQARRPTRPEGATGDQHGDAVAREGEVEHPEDRRAASQPRRDQPRPGPRRRRRVGVVELVGEQREGRRTPAATSPTAACDAASSRPAADGQDSRAQPRSPPPWQRAGAGQRRGPRGCRRARRRRRSAAPATTTAGALGGQVGLDGGDPVEVADGVLGERLRPAGDPDLERRPVEAHGRRQVVEQRARPARRRRGRWPGRRRPTRPRPGARRCRRPPRWAHLVDAHEQAVSSRPSGRGTRNPRGVERASARRRRRRRGSPARPRRSRWC